MKLFVDASALVAILAREPERFDLVDQLEQAEPIYSAMAEWEAAVALCRIQEHLDVDKARGLIRELASEYAMRMIEIGSEESVTALRAFARYGKGTGHPARLNMGDCFAYACARANGARLLYKGDDFAMTDLA